MAHFKRILCTMKENTKMTRKMDKGYSHGQQAMCTKVNIKMMREMDTVR